MKKRIEKIPVKYRQEIKADLDDLAKLIQAKREKLDLSQEELAERLDISTNTLKSIEQRIRFPSLPMLFYLSRVLKIQISMK